MIINAQKLQYVCLDAAFDWIPNFVCLFYLLMVNVVKLVTHFIYIMQVVHSSNEFSIEKHFFRTWRIWLRNKVLELIMRFIISRESLI